jgi:uncharacterized membrane protein YedE/YeeE
MNSRISLNSSSRPAVYMNPYLAGIGIGLVLLTAFVVTGRGLGASGAFASVVSYVVNLIAPAHTVDNPFYQKYLSRAAHPFQDSIFVGVIGVMIGGLVSGMIAGRVKRTIERGPRISDQGRMVLAFAGGVLMAFGAQFGRGCTSGQALTGGSLLNLGSWAFMLSVFAGGYGVAYFLRREWK